MWRNVLSDEGKKIAKNAERAQASGDQRLARELYLKAISKFVQATEISGDFSEVSVLRSLVSYYNERVKALDDELSCDPVLESVAFMPEKKQTHDIEITELLSGSGVEGAVFGAVLGIAIEISLEGREGHAIGTAFIIGDAASVMARSRQLVLNPFEGHSRDKRKLTDPDIRDNIKEFAQLDGIFVVSGDGVVEAAGRYITMDTGGVKLPGGLGTRHSSVAAITHATKAIGVVVSQSGGVIRIFKDGKIAATVKP
ncbi:DisA bacterial checkpoint controller nucleotide-binding protein [uncultured archaeon]|nr:DisA bacterial checkpoint controller nucleotide-binding protein [uncultured archaeon]